MPNLIRGVIQSGNKPVHAYSHLFRRSEFPTAADAFRGRDVYRSHDDRQSRGRILDCFEDEHTGDLSVVLEVDDELFGAVKSGDYRALSFGQYTPEKFNYEDFAVGVKQIWPKEVSVCKRGCLEEAVIQSAGRYDSETGSFIDLEVYCGFSETLDESDRLLDHTETLVQSMSTVAETKKPQETGANSSTTSGSASSSGASSSSSSTTSSANAATPIETPETPGSKEVVDEAAKEYAEAASAPVVPDVDSQLEKLAQYLGTDKHSLIQDMMAKKLADAEAAKAEAERVERENKEKSAKYRREMIEALEKGLTMTKTHAIKRDDAPIRALYQKAKAAETDDSVVFTLDDLQQYNSLVTEIACSTQPAQGKITMTAAQKALAEKNLANARRVEALVAKPNHKTVGAPTSVPAPATSHVAAPTEMSSSSSRELPAEKRVRYTPRLPDIPKEVLDQNHYCGLSVFHPRSHAEREAEAVVAGYDVVAGLDEDMKPASLVPIGEHIPDAFYVRFGADRAAQKFEEFKAAKLAEEPELTPQIMASLDSIPKQVTARHMTRDNPKLKDNEYVKWAEAHGCGDILNALRFMPEPPLNRADLGITPREIHNLRRGVYVKNSGRSTRDVTL